MTVLRTLCWRIRLYRRLRKIQVARREALHTARTVERMQEVHRRAIEDAL